MRHDPLNDAIVHMKNCEKKGKNDCLVKPTSKVIVEVLKVFQQENYLDEFEVNTDQKGGSINIKLNHKINDCGIIKPRFSVKHDEFTDWEKRFLPSRDFGVLVVSTPQGVMSHKKAKDAGIGGRLLAYVY